MRGLDPRIHQNIDSCDSMDCRVKPGNDEEDMQHHPATGTTSVAPARASRFTAFEATIVRFSA